MALFLRFRAGANLSRHKHRRRGADFGRTSAASKPVIGTEVVISLLGCVIIGVGSWEWLRPVILVGGFLFVFHDELRKAMQGRPLKPDKQRRRRGEGDRADSA